VPNVSVKNLFDCLYVSTSVALRASDTDGSHLGNEVPLTLEVKYQVYIAGLYSSFDNKRLKYYLVFSEKGENELVSD
jgi:hypothetical protein